MSQLIDDIAAAAFDSDATTSFCLAALNGADTASVTVSNSSARVTNILCINFITTYFTATNAQPAIIINTPIHRVKGIAS